MCFREFSLVLRLCGCFFFVLLLLLLFFLTTVQAAAFFFLSYRRELYTPLLGVLLVLFGGVAC